MKVVVATKNSGKLGEIQVLLSPLHWKCVSLSESYKQVAERGITFTHNALQKARAASRACSLPAISDDSGLVVPALQGEPGIRSARYAGNGRGDEANNLKLVEKVRSLPKSKRHAFYHCSLVYVSHADDFAPIVATGTLWGSIVFTPLGSHGFGYDSIFYVEKYKKTVAQLSSVVKNKISHRANASLHFIRELKNLSRV